MLITVCLFQITLEVAAVCCEEIGYMSSYSSRGSL